MTRKLPPRLSPLLQQLLQQPAGAGAALPSRLPLASNLAAVGMPQPPLTLATTSTMPSATAVLPPKKRSKLWELADKHHCPVIGTCFTMDELRKLARRFGIGDEAMDDFSLHVEAVGYARSRNEVSVTMQRQLERKFASTVAVFNKLETAAEVVAAWQHALDTGSVAGALWAAYTHKATDQATRQLIYGDIHMLSHQVGAGQAADMQRLQRLEAENRDLRQQQHVQQQQHLTVVQRHLQRLDQLEQEVQHLRQESALHEDERRRLARFENGEVVVDLGRQLLSLRAANEQLLQTAQRVSTLEAALAEHSATLGSLREALSDSERARAVLAQMLEEATRANETAVCDANGEDCQGCSQALSPRCILYVGGRTAMLAQYRQLAERLGIRLLHHDGGQEEALSRLPELIGGADAVLCPTDSVSHSAYYQVKSHCKRVGKPCLFYAGGGLSSFAQAMDRINRGEYSLAAQSEH